MHYYFFSLGMIFRSSVWLGFPGFIANISVVNGTDMWPSAFCVGSAVGTEMVSPSSHSWLTVPQRGEYERQTAVSGRKFGCESEPGYYGFSLCRTPASAFVPPAETPSQSRQGARCHSACGRAQGSMGQTGPTLFCSTCSLQECWGSGGQDICRSQGYRGIRVLTDIPEPALKPAAWFALASLIPRTHSTGGSAHLLQWKLQPG